MIQEGGIKTYTDGTHYYTLNQDVPSNAVEIDNTTYNVAMIDLFKSKYKDDRQASKQVTFALQYQGTAHTLVKKAGFSKEEAVAIVGNYKELYKDSVAYSKQRIQQATVDGYVSIAFGLKLRTPLLAKSVLGNSYTASEADAEARTVGNACSQSYGMLNSRAMVAFMQRVWSSKYRDKIIPVCMIHDAIYLIIDNDLDALHWVNQALIEEMQWQELPELQHPIVKLGGELDLFYPDWSNGITLANGISKEDILTKVHTAIGLI